MTRRQSRVFVTVAAGIVLLVGAAVVTVAMRPTYPERCAVHYAEGSMVWKVCIQRLRMGGEI